ncbi:type IV secretory system conjugative DNA transfer family protein [Acetobacter sp.]|uniref:type IV secretory system conjugative DNA transfer family protein n=1 Tax=Acetobacter sp. TaxID=440 RepID=UPI0039ED660C
MVARRIAGPVANQQISRERIYRDSRPWWTRWADDVRSPLAGWYMIVLAFCAWLVPAFTGPALVLAPVVAMWVLMRPESLPLHLPRYTGETDRNNLSPKDRKPQKADGIVYLGTEARTRRQIWMTSDAARQHAAIPGTTGAGKTTAIVSLAANPLAHGSGFILIDAKGDNSVYGDVLALARRFGLDDQVLVLNFLVASGAKDSNTFNPFSSGNADAIREMLVSQLGEAMPNDSNGVFRDRAVGLAGTIIPALVWMRDTHGVSINVDSIRYAMELRWIGTLARHKVFLIRNPESDHPFERSVPEIPADILWPLQAYLGELPGYDSTLEWNAQKENKPSEQHGYAKMYFSKVFTQLGVSLGHIFNVENADIIMRDVVLNRRILVTILPSLENSSDSLAGLGKIVVASQRGVMAQLLGAKLHGDGDEIFKLKAGSGDAPFHLFFDELAAFVTDGMDRMAAMGRGLNCMFWFSFQDLPGLTARIGEKAFTLLGNANLTHAMRLQDAMKTREWLEQQADKVEVSQVTHLERSEVGNLYAGQSAEIREVSRLPWSDLQTLLEGEAITMWGGRLTHSKTFFAKVNGRKGAVRRVQPVMLPVDKKGHAAAPDAETWKVLEAIEDGSFLAEEAPAPLAGSLTRFVADLANDNKTDIGRIIAEAGECAAEFAGTAGDPFGVRGQADTSFLNPLYAWAQKERDGFAVPPRPRPPIDAALLGRLTELEELSDVAGGSARRRASMMIGARDAFSEMVRLNSGEPDGSRLNEAAILAAARVLRDRLAA